MPSQSNYELYQAIDQKLERILLQIDGKFEKIDNRLDVLEGFKNSAIFVVTAIVFALSFLKDYILEKLGIKT